MSGGGGSGSDGGGDMQVSGAEAAYSTEKGISTHADTQISDRSFSPGGGDGPSYGYGEGQVDPGFQQANTSPRADTSTVGIAARDPYSDREIERGYTDDGQKLDYYGNKALTKAQAISLGLTQEVFDKDGNRTGEFEEGRYKVNENTGQLQRRDLTLSEHMKNAPALIKWSPTLSFLWGAGQNIGEWAKNKGWNWNSGTGKITDHRGNDIGERDLMNTAAPDAPGLISEQSNTQTTSGTYSASQWYTNLGNTNTTGSNPFSFSTALADAKSKQQTILGNTSAIGQLAVNKSPFYNWLKENSLNKGIL